jgi:antirestriction protein ArdC
MLCNRVGIENEKAFRNSAAYIQNWLTALQNDNRMVIWASKRAEEAAKYILGERREDVQTALQFSGG